MMRTKLPNRREHETEILEWGPPGNGTCEVFVSAGYDDFGRLRETFIRGGGRVGSDRDFLLDDIAVLISRGLQHNDSLDSMAAGMGRDETGRDLAGAQAPLSPLRIRLNRAAGRLEEAGNQPNEFHRPFVATAGVMRSIRFGRSSEPVLAEPDHSQVRSGLAAEGKRIRTIGPPE
jgi:hypothetical protein